MCEKRNAFSFFLSIYSRVFRTGFLGRTTHYRVVYNFMMILLMQILYTGQSQLLYEYYACYYEYSKRIHGKICHVFMVSGNVTIRRISGKIYPDSKIVLHFSCVPYYQLLLESEVRLPFICNYVCISVVPVSASYYSSSSSFGTIIFKITVLVLVLEP